MVGAGQLNGLPMTVDAEAVDLDGDGKIDGNDKLIMNRVLNGLPV